ncbi:MAG: universal stress protein [Chitinophagaceae bacterium]
MKTIIVATDFSQAAMNAVNYAADMALSIQADLLLLHIYPMPVSYTEMPLVANLEQLQQSAEEELNIVSENLTRRMDFKLSVKTNVITGSFFEELATLCAKIKPYAVVMASQGTSATERFLFGGHTVYAMKHLMWPLITVPPNAQYSSIKEIGLACDFEKPVDTIPLDEIIKIVDDFHANIHILNTGRKDVFNPEIVFQSGLLQEKLMKLKPVFNFITGQNINDSILDFVEKNQIDLLIVLPKRYGLLDMIVHKSNTKRFVLHSHVPVLALQA